MAGVQVKGGKGGLAVDGFGRIAESHFDDHLVAPVEVISPASIASLKQGLRRWARGSSRYVTVGFVEAPAGKVLADPDMYPRQPVEIHYWSGPGDEELSLFAMTYGDPKDGIADVRAVEALIRPMALISRAKVEVTLDDDESDYGGFYQLGFSITPEVRGRTVGELYALAKSLIALADAYLAQGDLNRATTLNLLRGGHADVLIGQSETSWIDFKREPYKKDDHGKLELAKDVAAFANAEGGLIVLGVAAPKAGGRDVASKIMPCAPGDVSAQSYRAVIARRVCPLPERIEIFPVPQMGGDVWVVSVPPQPPELKPFLVHGAAIARKVNDSFSIVTRSEDETISMTPHAVHALITAGRAALGVAGKSSRDVLDSADVMP